MVANLGVLLAATGSYLLVSRWPDILVGSIIAGLFLSSAIGVLRQSLQELQAPPPVQTARPVTMQLSRKPGNS
jgi:Co/Zn/Cd efflux system component